MRRHSMGQACVSPPSVAGQRSCEGRGASDGSGCPSVAPNGTGSKTACRKSTEPRGYFLHKSEFSNTVFLMRPKQLLPAQPCSPTRRLRHAPSRTGTILSPTRQATGSHPRHRERSAATQGPPRPCFGTFGGGIRRLPEAAGVSGSPRRFAPREDGAPCLGATSDCDCQEGAAPNTALVLRSLRSRRLEGRCVPESVLRDASPAAPLLRTRSLLGAWQLRRVAIGAARR